MSKRLKTIWLIFMLVILIIISFMISEYKRKEDLKKYYSIDVLDTSKYNKITTDDLLELISKNELSLIYIGKNNCDSCFKENDVLSELIEEYKIKINYLSIVKITPYIQYEKLAKLEKDFKNGVSTPTLMLVKDNKIVMYKTGFISKDDLVKELKNNKFI